MKINTEKSASWKIVDGDIQDGNGKWICVMSQGKGEEKWRSANAELIVRAVNLLEALEEVEKAADWQNRNWHSSIVNESLTKLSSLKKSLNLE